MKSPQIRPLRRRAASPLAACVAMPPTAGERAEFGDVAVFPLAAASTTHGQGGGIGELVAAAIGAGAAVVWFPFSVVGGAVTAPEPEEIDAAEPVLLAVVDDAGVRERFLARCSEAVRARAGRELVELSDARTVVEVRLVSIARGRAWNWWTFDRPFEAVVKATARVVRRADGHVVWEETRTWSSDEVVHTYAGWARDDGAALRAEVDSALVDLADGFAFTIFTAQVDE